MPKFEYGLNARKDNPQKYYLSHILAGYQKGFKGSDTVLMQVGVKDDSVKSDRIMRFLSSSKNKKFIWNKTIL